MSVISEAEFVDLYLGDGFADAKGLPGQARRVEAPAEWRADLERLRLQCEEKHAATQDPELRKRLKVDAAAKRTANFLNCSREELKTFARITGHKDVHEMNVDDLCTINREISEFTDIAHA